jgi:hypothetical protein
VKRPEVALAYLLVGGIFGLLPTLALLGLLAVHP